VDHCDVSLLFAIVDSLRRRRLRLAVKQQYFSLIGFIKTPTPSACR